MDLREAAANPKAFYTTVSEHLPVRAQFKTGPNND